jgi:diacylglycerol kinase (ATP)
MPDHINDAILIYNPASGRRRHRRFAEVERAAQILKEAGIRAELASTTGAGTATTIARQAVAARRSMVIACGGDGTINEVVNGLAKSDAPMAVLPAGTANILAKELGIPWDIPHASRLIAGGTVRRIALGLAVPMNGNASAVSGAGRYFLSVAGAGPDGAIVNSVNGDLKKNTGEFAYWMEGFRQLLQYDFPEIRIRSGNEERKATIIVVGRTVHYGGPFKITTGANLFKDQFEFLINSRRSRLAYLACLPALWLGTLRQMKGIETWTATETFCEPANGEAVYAQVDGEPVGPLPMAFRIVPDALSIVTPASKV